MSGEVAAPLQAQFRNDSSVTKEKVNESKRGRVSGSEEPNNNPLSSATRKWVAYTD